MFKLLAIASLLFCASASATLNSDIDKPVEPPSTDGVLALRSEGTVILISKKTGPCQDGDHLAGYADAQGKHAIGCWFDHGEFVFVQWRDGDMSRLPKNKFEPYTQ